MKKKILIVDDLRGFIEKEKGILSRSDFKVFTATSGEEALRIHKEERVDLILADLHMPEMGGDELCREIRADESLRHVSIILVSSNRQADLDRCASAGANECVPRRIEPQKLLERVSSLLSIPKREHLRVLIKVSVKGQIKSEPFFGTTQNISTSGVLLETEKPLAKGDVITCSFFIPDSDRIIADGEVKRKTKTDGGLYHYGVQFIGVSPEGKKAIEAFVKKKLRA